MVVAAAKFFVVVAVAFFSIRIGVAEEEHAAGVAVFEDVEIERRFCDFSFRERRRREEEEEEESRSSMTPEVQTRPPLPPKNLPSSSSPTPFDPSNIIASVVERKKIERLAELREIERVKEGKYGVVTPRHGNFVTGGGAKGGKSSSFEEEYERKEKEVKVALDEVVHSLGKM